MAMFVIAGRADCPRFARAEMVADRLAASLPHFRVHKVVQASEDWPSWLSEQCSQNGWKHRTGSPLIWRELVDRGGKGLYLGGLSEFEQYASHYHGVEASTSTELEEAIAKENMDTFLSLKLEEENAPKITPLRVCITNACSSIAYHLVHQVATDEVFGNEEKVAIQLYDRNPDNREELEGLVLELVDLASPTLHEVRVASSVQEAMDCVSMAYILDYPYKPVMETATHPADENQDSPDNGREGEDKQSTTVERESSSTPKIEEVGGLEKEDNSVEDKSLSGKEEGSGAEERGSGAEEREKVIEKETHQEGEEEDQVDNAESASSPPQPSSLSTDQSHSELESAAQLYHCYGATIDFSAQKNVRVIVCGRYANTGAALMAGAVSSIDKSNFIASSAVAEQQAKSIISSNLSLNGADVTQVGVWGRTCGNTYADLSHVRVSHFPGAVVGPNPFNLPITRCNFDADWLETGFSMLFESRHKKMEGYRKNGYSLVEAIGLVQLTRQWRQDDVIGGGGGWRCVGVASSADGEGGYGIPVGVVFSQPVCLNDGQWEPVELVTAQKVKEGIAAQVDSLVEELDIALKAVKKDADTSSSAN